MVELPILVAEDSADDAYLLKRAFARAGLSNPVRFVGDGEQVLAYLRGDGAYADRERHPFPGLLLLDIKMPRMNGLEVLTAIRKDPALQRLVVVFLTSSGQERDINSAFELRANSYLVKPSRPEDLVALVESLKAYWLSINRFPKCPE